jgi:pyruvate formate lyase activating enzyme
VAEVMKDVDYFKTSGGGVTLSGGEVMMQPKFAMAILSLAKQMNLSTCVETSCYTRASVLSPFLEKVDHWMVDIKAFDDELHRKLTGVSNRMILQNIMALSQADASLILRLPIIPSLNDHRDNLLACADYILSLPSKPKEVQLLPYHSMGESKKTLLGQDIDAATRFQTPTDEMVRNWHECFKERGVETASPEG